MVTWLNWDLLAFALRAKSQGIGVYRLVGACTGPPFPLRICYSGVSTRSVPPIWPLPRCESFPPHCREFRCIVLVPHDRCRQGGRFRDVSTYAGHTIGPAMNWPSPRCEQYCITPLRPIRRCQQLHPKISWVGGWFNYRRHEHYY